MISQSEVEEYFEYKNGFLFWKKKFGRSPIKIGSMAGGIHTNKRGVKRRHIKFKGKTFKTARLIFLLHRGYLPENVDHKDRDTLNDLIENLREASWSQNARNKSSRKNSSSKYLGVSFVVQKGKWVACIMINGKNKTLGAFINEDDAAIAYNDAANIHHKEFANLNIIN